MVAAAASSSEGIYLVLGLFEHGGRDSSRDYRMNGRSGSDEGRVAARLGVPQW